MTNPFKLAWNLTKVKDIISNIYNVITKVIAVFGVIATQIDPSKLGKVGKYIPVVSDTLTKIKNGIDVIAPILNVDVTSTVSVQSVNDKVDIDVIANDLISALKQLDKSTK